MNDSPQTIEDVGLRCPECGYNLTGLTIVICPECGKAYNRAALLAGENGRFPIWGRRTEIGFTRAFIRTTLEIWLHPERFGRQLPSRPKPSDAIVYSTVCLIIAVLTQIPFAIHAAINIPTRTDQAIVLIGIVIGVLACENSMAAIVFASRRNVPNEYTQNLAVVRMTRAFLILSAVWIFVMRIAALMFNFRWLLEPVLLGGLVTIVIYWWISIAYIAKSFHGDIRNLYLAICMVPISMAMGVMFGTVGCFVAASILRLF